MLRAILKKILPENYSRFLSALCFVACVVGTILFSKLLVSQADIPFFIAFNFSLFVTVCGAILIVILYFTGTTLRIKTPKALPMLVHVSGFVQAISLGLWMLSLRESDPAVFISLFGVFYIYLMILPMFVKVHFRTCYNFGLWRCLALGIFMIVSVILIIVNNPVMDPVWAVVLLMTVGVCSADYFIKIKLLLDFKLSPECIMAYSTLESVVWLFGMAFILDMGIVLKIPDFDIHIGWIALGAVIFLALFLSSSNYLYGTAREDRSPFTYQVAWALTVFTAPFIYGINIRSVNIAGIVMIFVGTTIIEYLESRSQHQAELNTDKEWTFETEKLGVPINVFQIDDPPKQ